MNRCSTEMDEADAVEVTLKNVKIRAGGERSVRFCEKQNEEQPADLKRVWRSCRRAAVFLKVILTGLRTGTRRARRKILLFSERTLEQVKLESVGEMEKMSTP